MSDRYGIVGGGIVGVALARALAQRGSEVTVFEKESALAVHQTGHNSGVVHAGIHYAPGSLKAELCRRGRDLTRDYCAEKGLPYREVGKLVVAVTEAELGALDALEVRATANAVPGLKRLDYNGIREIEPYTGGVAGLHSPHTASVDYVAITEAMADDARAAGGAIKLNAEMTAIRQERSVVHVTAGAHDYALDRLIVCAGLQSDIVARLVGAPPSPRILPFRGEYWAMDPLRADMVRGMIYPVPDPRFPFLGVHFTRGVYDDVHIGPNAVPAMAREGYRCRDVSLRDTLGALTWPGAPSLMWHHWRMGVREVSSSVLKPLYYRAAKRYLPELRISDLTHRTAAGVRAQAWGRGGELLDDFAVDHVGAVTLIRNAPSPAATSAMSIAKYTLEYHDASQNPAERKR